MEFGAWRGEHLECVGVKDQGMGFETSLHGITSVKP